MGNERPRRGRQGGERPEDGRRREGGEEGMEGKEDLGTREGEGPEPSNNLVRELS